MHVFILMQLVSTHFDDITKNLFGLMYSLSFHVCVNYALMWNATLYYDLCSLHYFFTFMSTNSFIDFQESEGFIKSCVDYHTKKPHAKTNSMAHPGHLMPRLSGLDSIDSRSHHSLKQNTNVSKHIII